MFPKFHETSVLNRFSFFFKFFCNSHLDHMYLGSSKLDCSCVKTQLHLCRAMLFHTPQPDLMQKIITNYFQYHLPLKLLNASLRAISFYFRKELTLYRAYLS